MDYVELGLLIKKTRKEKGYGLIEIAELTYSNKTTIADVEKGIIRNIELIRRICNILDIDLDSILLNNDKIKEIDNMLSNIDGKNEKESFVNSVLAYFKQQGFAVKVAAGMTGIAAALVIINGAVYATTNKHIWQYLYSTADNAYYKMGEDVNTVPSSDPVDITNYAPVVGQEKQDDFAISMSDMADLTKKFRVNIYLPTIVPDDYAFTSATLLPHKGMTEAVIIFTNSVNKYNLTINIMEQLTDTPANMILGVDGDETERTITIDGEEVSCKVRESKEHSSTVYFTFSNAFYLFSHKLPTDEILKVIESMAQIN